MCSSIVSCDSLELPAEVNAVTGTHWDNTPAPAMSDEEKERSAEELMNLIDRLNDNGIFRLQLGRKPDK